MKHVLRYLFLAPTALFAAAPVPTEVIPERLPGAKPRNVVFILSGLYQMMGSLGGMEIPLNQPAGGFNRIRLRDRGGDKAADFPSPFVVDEPTNHDANKHTRRFYRRLPLTS